MNLPALKTLAPRALIGLALCLGLGLATPALAHGEATARHGGVVKKANDLSFELANKPEGATVFIEDHGKPLAAAGYSGKITVLRGGQKIEKPLQPGKANEMVANGVQLAAGDRAVVVLTSPTKQAISIRFALP